MRSLKDGVHVAQLDLDGLEGVMCATAGTLVIYLRRDEIMASKTSEALEPIFCPPDLSERPFQLTVDRAMTGTPSILFRAWAEQLDHSTKVESWSISYK
jgi:hypothetical protein